MLQIVDLSVNDLESVPNEIGKWSQLKSLDLHDNLLESIPESVENLKNLKVRLYLYILFFTLQELVIFLNIIFKQLPKTFL